jgi:hypothetical protein
MARSPESSKPGRVARGLLVAAVGVFAITGCGEAQRPGDDPATVGVELTGEDAKTIGAALNVHEAASGSPDQTTDVKLGETTVGVSDIAGKPGIVEISNLDDGTIPRLEVDKSETGGLTVTSAYNTKPADVPGVTPQDLADQRQLGKATEEFLASLGGDDLDTKRATHVITFDNADRTTSTLPVNGEAAADIKSGEQG